MVKEKRAMRLYVPFLLTALLFTLSCGAGTSGTSTDTTTSTTGGTIDVSVTSGMTPQYSWTGGDAYTLSVIRVSAPAMVVWGVQSMPTFTAAATNTVASPVTHGTVPAGLMQISYLNTEATLTSGVAYRVSVSRADGSVGWREFTPGGSTTSGAAGQAFETSGTTDKITALDTGLPSGSAARTIEFWLNTTQTTGEHYAVSYGTLLSGKALYVGVYWGLANVTQIGNSFTGTTNIADGKWHHLAVVLPGGTQPYELYVDGKKEGGKAMTTNTTLKGLVIGSTVEGENKPTVGKIDEVRIWNAARTVGQINASMNTQLIGNEAGLVLYYDMNATGQGAGITVQNKATSTGSALDGTTVGGTTSPAFAASAAF